VKISVVLWVYTYATGSLAKVRQSLFYARLELEKADTPANAKTCPGLT
jgi:hypothetical protein